MIGCLVIFPTISKMNFLIYPSKGMDNLNSDHISFFIPKYVMLVKDNQLEGFNS